MSIPFLNGFILTIDAKHKPENPIEDGLSSIGVLSAMAQDCTDLVASFREGGEPNERMLTQAVYSTSVLSGLVANVSDILVELEINRQ